jgi:hypothetical protein
MRPTNFDVVKEICERYGLAQVKGKPGTFEKVGDDDEPHFKGVARTKKVTVTVVSRGYRLVREFVDGSIDDFVDAVVDDLEYLLDPGSLQDDGFEPED